MSRIGRYLVLGVAAALTVFAVVAVVQLNARQQPVAAGTSSASAAASPSPARPTTPPTVEVNGCRVPRDQRELIDALKVDPLFAVAPDDGQLIEQRLVPMACDDHPTSSGPHGTHVNRLYHTPRTYSLARLHQRFGPPATTAGWTIVTTYAYLEPPAPGSTAWILYCRVAGERVWFAAVTSSGSEFDDGNPRVTPIVGVQVNINVAPTGTTCNPRL